MHRINAITEGPSSGFNGAIKVIKKLILTVNMEEHIRIISQIHMYHNVRVSLVRTSDSLRLTLSLDDKK